jgi:hypothetical protein
VKLQCLREGILDRFFIACIALYAIEVRIAVGCKQIWTQIVGCDFAALCYSLLKRYILCKVQPRHCVVVKVA